MTIVEMYERRDQLAADLATLDQMIKAEAMRLAGIEEEREKRTGRKRLTFDPDGKTIRWNGGSVRLGEKPCKFVRTLFEKRRVLFTSMATVVWGNSLIPSETIRVTVCNLRKALVKANFPYEIITIETKKIETKARDVNTGKVRNITVQPKISGFKFSVKK